MCIQLAETVRHQAAALQFLRTSSRYLGVEIECDTLRPMQPSRQNTDQEH